MSEIEASVVSHERGEPLAVSTVLARATQVTQAERARRASEVARLAAERRRNLAHRRELVAWLQGMGIDPVGERIYRIEISVDVREPSKLHIFRYATNAAGQIYSERRPDGSYDIARAHVETREIADLPLVPRLTPESGESGGTAGTEK